MPFLNSNEKATMNHLAKQGDLHSQAWADHEAELVNLRLGREGYVVIAKFATTAPITLATTALTAIDGVTPVAGDIVLVKDQASAIQNGLYVASAGAWTRLKDVNGNDVLKTGVIVSVSQGTAGLDTLWTLTSDAGFVVGTNNVAFAQYVATGVATGTLAAVGGAALVGIADADSRITGTTVEAALTELIKYVPVLVADPGTAAAIPVTHSAHIEITTAAAETNTLAIPTFVGQRLILNMDVWAVGDRVITSAQRINQAANTIMTFGAAGDCIVLEAIKIGGALRWQVTANDGVALS